MTATLYINGGWKANGRTFVVRNPATRQPVAECSDGDAAAACAAADAAASAFPRWAAAAPDERARLLHRLADLLERDAAALSRILVAESGKPRAEAAREVASSAAYLRWNAEEGRRCYGRTAPALHAGAWLCTVRQPR